jgi:hypothetical protein
MWKKIVAISLVLVVVLSFTACGEAGLPSAQEIIDGVIESFDNIKTYQFDMDVTMDVAGESEGGAVGSTMTIANSGTLDLENVQMRVDIAVNSSTVAPEEDDQEMRVELYITDGMMYNAMSEAPEEEPTWMKEEVSPEAWENLKAIVGLETYKELIETVQVEVIGSEKVKGVDCYLLQLTPKMAQLWQIAMQPIGGGVFEGGILPSVPEEFLQEVFRSFSVRQWIAKDTYFLMKVKIDIVIESTPELMDYLEDEEGEMTIDLSISLLAYNYNQPVSIVLPQEAKEAIAAPNGE